MESLTWGESSLVLSIVEKHVYTAKAMPNHISRLCI